MNPATTVVSLLLLISTLLHVNGASIELQTKIIPHDSISISNDENNKPSQSNILSKELNETATGVSKTTAVIINQNPELTKKTLPAFEAEDMQESFVYSKNDDDDDDDDSATLNGNTTVASTNLVNTTTLYEMMRENEKHATLAAKFFPDIPDRSITDLPADIQRKFTHEMYTVGSDETNAAKASASDVNIVPVINTTESFNQTIQGSLSTLENRQQMLQKHLKFVAMLEDKSEQEKIDKLSPGVIALLSAIGFAALAVFAYFGLIGWKRYQEYLHGHRELLVNDFDSNDINNFEL